MKSINSISDDKHLYPTTRFEYQLEVGAVSQNNVIPRILESIGCEAKVKHVLANGVDIPFSKDGKKGVFEVFNEDKASYIDETRAKSMRKNLRGYKYKGIICSHGNYNSPVKKILKHIRILRLGYQILTIDYHKFYRRRDETYKRRMQSSRTLRATRKAVINFLVEIGFLSPMYYIYDKISYHLIIIINLPDKYSNTEDIATKLLKLRDVLSGIEKLITAFSHVRNDTTFLVPQLKTENITTNETNDCDNSKEVSKWTILIDICRYVENKDYLFIILMKSITQTRMEHHLRGRYRQEYYLDSRSLFLL